MALETLQQVQNHDGKKAFDEIVRLHENPTAQNKLESGRSFISLKMYHGESIPAYKLRASDNLKRIKELKVNLEDLHTSIFIEGLRPELDGLKTSLYTQGEMDFEKVSELTAGHVQRLSSSPQKSAHQAHFSLDQGQGEDDSSLQVITHEEFAMVAALRAKRKDGLSHDVEANPDKATEYEKTLTCNNCGTKGHAKRTCKKRKQAFLTTRVATPM